MNCRGFKYLAIFLAGLSLPACRQDMAKPPSYRPLQASTFFEDGRSARPWVAGTVPRGRLQTDTELFTGRRPLKAGDWSAFAAVVAAAQVAPLPALAGHWDWSPYTDTLPLPITRADLERGRERFDIYCSVCHDRVGTGHGMIVRRGFTPPPSYHSDYSRGLKLRGILLKLPEAPVGYYFEVITHGFGAMADYASQVSVEDRWRIIAYIRALQLSQHARMADIGDAEVRAKLLQDRGDAP